MKKIALVAFVSLLALTLTSYASALEKLKFGTSVKLYHGYYLPIFSAQEHGFFKENGLEVEYVPFKGGAALNAAMAARHINVAMSMAPSVLLGAAGGLPLVMVGEVIARNDFYLWVRTDSRFRTVKDLKGASLGVHMLRTTSHAYGLMVVKAEGLEKDVRFVGTGGLVETAAALKAKAVDVAAGYPLSTFTKLAAAGEVRPIVNIYDYLPKEWLDFVIYAHGDFIKASPETVRRTVRGTVQGIDFMRKNPRWAIEKIKSEEGLSEKEAMMLWEREGTAIFTRDGKIGRKAVENIRQFMVEYDLVAKEKLPPVDNLFSAAFAP